MHPWIPEIYRPAELGYASSDSIPQLPAYVLESTYIPTDAETAEAAVIISKIASDLTECARVLAYLRDTESLIVQHKMNLLRIQKHYNHFRSPIRRLPSELLSQIFLSRLDWRFDSHWVIRTLTRVCKRWNGIVHGTAQLWTDLKVSRSRTTYRSLFASACRQCTAKSGSLKLSVDISPWNADADEGSPSSEDLELLFSASNRITSFILSTEPSDWVESFIRQFEQTSMAALRHISVLFSASTSARALSVRLNRGLLPSLRSISVWEGSIDVDASRDVLNNIADLSWYGQYRDGKEDVFPILSVCSNAEKLSFFDVHVWTTPHHVQRSILAVKRLSITCGNQGVTRSIFRGLTTFHCPSLLSCTFTSGAKLDEALPRLRAAELAGFVRNSGCMLQKLRLVGFALPPERLRQLLQCVPQLVDLSLPRCATSKTGDGCLSETLEVFVWGTPDSVLPELHSLDLYAEASAVGALHDVILSRREKLRKVDIAMLYRKNEEEKVDFATAFGASRWEEMKQSCGVDIHLIRI